MGGGWWWSWADLSGAVGSSPRCEDSDPLISSKGNVATRTFKRVTFPWERCARATLPRELFGAGRGNVATVTF